MRIWAFSRWSWCHVTASAGKPDRELQCLDISTEHAGEGSNGLMDVLLIDHHKKQRLPNCRQLHLLRLQKHQPLPQIRRHLPLREYSQICQVEEWLCQVKSSLSPHIFHWVSLMIVLTAPTSECEMEGIECRVFELEGLGRALQDVRCGECGAIGLVYEEDFSKRQSLYTVPCSICDACGQRVIIPEKQSLPTVRWR